MFQKLITYYCFDGQKIARLKFDVMSKDFVLWAAMMKVLLLSIALIAIGDAFSLSSKTARPSTTLFSVPETSLDRRAFVWSGVAASLAITTNPLPSVAAGAGVDYKAVASVSR
jgi:hypothetical protein